MKILIINFNLEGQTREEYDAVGIEAAPLFTKVPGLISKHFLEDDDTNTYGGVYVFEDQESLDNYLKSDIFEMINSNPKWPNVTTRIFGVIEAPSLITGAKAKSSF